LTRLVDPDAALRQKIVELVENGEFGLASGTMENGGYERLWYAEQVAADEVAFEQQVFLLTRARSEEIASSAAPQATPPETARDAGLPAAAETKTEPEPEPEPVAPSDGREAETSVRLQVSGDVPPESWNRIGTKVIPKLRSGKELAIRVQLDVEVAAPMAATLDVDLRQALDDLGLAGKIVVKRLE